MNGNLVPGKREVKIGDWFSESMRLTMDNLGPHLLVGLILTLIFLVLTFTVIGLLVCVPLWCGAFYYAQKRMLNRPVEINDLFRGFDIFTQALLANLIVAGVVVGISVVTGIALGVLVGIPILLVSSIGTCCPLAGMAAAMGSVPLLIILCIPALIIEILLSGISLGLHALLPGLLLNRKMAAMDAIKLSYSLALKNFWQITLFGIVVTLVSMAGVLLTCGLGSVFIGPWLMFANAVVYRDWIGFTEEEPAPMLTAPPEPPTQP